MVTPLLHRAAECGDADQIRLLLARGARIDAFDSYGQTALMRAAHSGYLDAARVLIESGASLDTTAKYCLSAMMLAIIGGHQSVAVAIIEAGGDPTLQGCGPAGFNAKTARDLADEGHLETVLVALDGR